MLFGEFAKMEMILYDLLKKPRRLWGIKTQTRPSTYDTSYTRKKADLYDKYLDSS